MYTYIYIHITSNRSFRYLRFNPIEEIDLFDWVESKISKTSITCYVYIYICIHIYIYIYICCCGVVPSWMGQSPPGSSLLSLAALPCKSEHACVRFMHFSRSARQYTLSALRVHKINVPAWNITSSQDIPITVLFHECPVQSTGVPFRCDFDGFPDCLLVSITPATLQGPFSVQALYAVDQQM